MAVKIYNVSNKNIRIREKISLPQLSLDANYIQDINNTSQYSRSVDGNVYYSNPENVVLDTVEYDSVNGSTQSLKIINTGTDVNFPLNDPKLYNKEFYFRVRAKLTSNESRLIVYYHTDPNEVNYNDRLLIGNGSGYNQNLNVWNNQQTPILNYGTNLAGDWKTIEFYYNGSNTFQAYVDGVQIYSENYTIQNYTNWFNYIHIKLNSGVWIDRYEVQIEGINWNNPTIGQG